MELLPEHIGDAIIAAMHPANWVSETVYELNAVVDDANFKVVAVITGARTVPPDEPLPAVPMTMHLSMYRDFQTLPLTKDIELMMMPVFVQHALKDYLIMAQMERDHSDRTMRFAIYMRLKLFDTWFDLRTGASMPEDDFRSLSQSQQFWGAVFERIKEALTKLMITALPCGVEFAAQLMPKIAEQYDYMATGGTRLGSSNAISVHGVPWDTIKGAIKINSSAKDPWMTAISAKPNRQVRV